MCNYYKNRKLQRINREKTKILHILGGKINAFLIINFSLLRKEELQIVTVQTENASLLQKITEYQQKDVAIYEQV